MNTDHSPTTADMNVHVISVVVEKETHLWHTKVQAWPPLQLPVSACSFFISIPAFLLTAYARTRKQDLLM